MEEALAKKTPRTGPAEADGTTQGPEDNRPSWSFVISLPSTAIKMLMDFIRIIANHSDI